MYAFMVPVEPTQRLQTFLGWLTYMTTVTLSEGVAKVSKFSEIVKFHGVT